MALYRVPEHVSKVFKEHNVTCNEKCQYKISHQSEAPAKSKIFRKYLQYSRYNKGSVFVLCVNIYASLLGRDFAIYSVNISAMQDRLTRCEPRNELSFRIIHHETMYSFHFQTNLRHLIFS